MRVLWMVCLGALFIAPSATADSPVQGYIVDRFVDLPLDEFTAGGGCGPGFDDAVQGEITFNASTDSFTFSEGAYDSGDPVPWWWPSQAGAESRAVCAWAEATLDVPNGTDHVHIRFDADRRITQDVTLDAHLPQQVVLFDGHDGSELARVDYFAWDEGSRDMTRFAYLGPGDLNRFPIPEDTTSLRLRWYFEDEGQTIDRGQESAASGQAFEATVVDPRIEFSSDVQPLEASETQARSGQVMQHTTTTSILIDPDVQVGNIRVRTDPGVQFSHIVAPDGARIDATGVLPPGAEYGPDVPFILLERNSEAGFQQVTIPDVVSRTHGEGTYVFHFVDVQRLDAEPTLMAFNAILVVLPVGLAALAGQRIREFQREAFGHYHRTATHLLVATGLVLAYHVLVVLSAILSGWFTSMAVLPAGREAWLLYGQVALALMAFTWLWLTGRQLGRIVRPDAAPLR